MTHITITAQVDGAGKPGERVFRARMELRVSGSSSQRLNWQMNVRDLARVVCDLHGAWL